MSEKAREAQDEKRAEYVAPELTAHGTFESITRQDVGGQRFDASFSAGDLIPDAFSS